MEELLFYQYMDHQKKHATPLAKRLFILPLRVWILFAIPLIAGVISMCLLLRDLLGWAFWAALIECVGSVVLEIHIERLRISRSHITTQDRFAEWYQLKDWLAETPFSNSDILRDIKERTERYIKEREKADKEKRSQQEKRLQVLVVPIVLAVTNKIINGQTEMAQTVSTVIVVFVVCGVTYGIIKMGFAAWNFPQIWKIRQMTVFAADLQGVLDIETFNIPQCEKPVKSKVDGKQSVRVIKMLSSKNLKTSTNDAEMWETSNHQSQNGHQREAETDNKKVVIMEGSP